MINWPIDQPTLTVGEITLRPLRESDIDDIYQACQDPTISAFTRVPNPYGREMAEEFVRGSDISYRNHQGIVFIIEVAGKLAGTIGLHGIQLSDHCAEIGYWVEKNYRGKGLCTSALLILIDFSLKVMEFRRLEALADFNNAASQRVMERAGMTRDALLRNRVTKPNGDQIDMVMYSIVKE